VNLHSVSRDQVCVVVVVKGGDAFQPVPRSMLDILYARYSVVWCSVSLSINYRFLVQFILGWAMSGRNDVEKLGWRLEAHKSALELGLDTYSVYLPAVLRSGTPQTRYMRLVSIRTFAGAMTQIPEDF
jgi:hypothetical protein